MKIFLLSIALSLVVFNFSNAQILCVECYDQNDSISSNVTNLLVNGGFEDTPCPPSTGVIGEQSSWCSTSNGYVCDFTGWTSGGGGTSSYSCLYNTVIGKSIIIEGNNAAYFGNFYCNLCNGNGEDTSCLVNLGCSVTGIPAGYPFNPDPSFGGSNALYLEQTVNDLVPGDVYALEFWAGGEEYYGSEGIFALDIGYGDTLLRCKSTGPGETGLTYLIQFQATSSSQTIKFSNWGHICSNCTELVLDNVRLYPIGQLSSTIEPCFTPSVDFAASNTEVCEKFCLSFSDSSSNDPTAWYWSFPGASPSFSTDQNPANVCYDEPGVYDVTLVTTSANGNDTLTLSNYITVYPTPAIPTITQNGYSLTSSPADFYQWQLDAVDIPGATNQSYDVLQTGFYTVIVSDTNSCKNSTTLYVQITGFGQVSSANISIYPNPSSGNFIIEWMNAQSSDDISIIVENSIGQKVFSSDEKISSSDWKKEIDLSSMSRGVYFIEIKTPDSSLKKKIIISQ